MLGLPGNLSRTMPANTGVAGLLPPGMPGATNVPAGGGVFTRVSLADSGIESKAGEGCMAGNGLSRLATAWIWCRILRQAPRNAGITPIAECNGATLRASPGKPGRTGAGVGSGTNSAAELPEFCRSTCEPEQRRKTWIV